MQTIPDGTRVRAIRPNGDILEGPCKYLSFISCGEYYLILLDTPYTVEQAEVRGRLPVGRRNKLHTVNEVTPHGMYSIDHLTIV